MLKYLFFACLVFCSVGLLSASCPEVDQIDDYYNSNNIEGFQTLLTRFDSCASSEELKAYAFHQLGRTYGDLKEYELALRYAQKALAIREKILDPNDDALGMTLYNIGLFSGKLLEFNQAEENLNRAAAIFLEIGQAVRHMIVQKEIANIAVAKGDFDKANDILQSNIEVAATHGENIRKANFHVDLANVRLSQQRPKEAIEELQEAIVLYTANRNHPRFDEGNLASCYLNLAYANAELNQASKALNYYQQAINGYRRINETYNEAKARANQSLTLISLGRNLEAERELDQAERLAKTGPYIDILAQVSDNRGDLYLARKRPKAALNAYQNAVKELVVGWQPESDIECPPLDLLLQTAYPEHLINHLFDKVQCMETCGEDSLVIQHYYALSSLIDEMRHSQRVQASKLFWRGLVSPIYESAVRFAHKQMDMEVAYFFMERSKSMLLLDALEENVVRAEMDPADARKERDLRLELEQFRLELTQSPDEAHVGLRESIVQLQRDWEVYQDSLVVKYPSYAARRLNKDPLKPTQISNLLPTEDWLLVEYMIGDSALYVWSMSGTGYMNLRAVPIGKFEEQLAAYLIKLQDAGRVIEPTAYAVQANYLYKSLLEPELAANPENKLLLIIPDGPISFIPFDALMVVPNWSPRNFLVNEYQIRFAYSAEVLVRQQAVQIPKGRVLSVAPVFKAPDQRELDPILSSGATLDQLSIGKMRVLFEEEASVEEFVKYVSNSPVINLFTHAAAEPGEIPKVEFFDRAMLLPEMYGLQIQADLIFLSACQTALGEIHKGEGAMSLSRGFTYAGASSLISSLWKLNEETTSQIFVDFYSNLQAGKTKSEALWDAKKQYLANTNPQGTNPYMWAGLVFFGADNTLDIPRQQPWGLFVALGLGILLLLVLWRRKNNKKIVKS